MDSPARTRTTVAALVVGAVLLALLLHLAGVEELAAALAAAAIAGAVAAALRVRRLPRRQVDPVEPVPGDAVARAGALWPLFAAWVVAATLLTPSIRAAVNGPDATSGYSPLLVLVLLITLPLIALPLVRVVRTPRRRLALPVVLVALLAVKLGIAMLLLKVPPFDAGSVFLAAYGDAVPTAADYPFNRGFNDYYFSIYPNNLTLAWILSLLFRVVALTGITGFGTYAAVGVLLNCVVLTLTELLTFRVVARLWGARTAWWALAATAVFTTLSPWLNTPYSDTLGSVFPIAILALWAWLRSARTRPSLLGRAAVLGAVASLGIAVKPTVLFALVAVVAVDVLRHRRVLRRRAAQRALGAVLALGVVAGVAVSLGSTALIGVSGLTSFDVWTNRNGFPPAHFLKMGATGNGGFDNDDVQATSALPPEERTPEALRVYAQRVLAFGPEGYGLFLGEKALRTFGDGAFGQGAEGDPFPDYVLNDRFSYRFREWYTRGAPHHGSLASFWQASWLLLLAASAIPAGRFTTGRRRQALDTARIGLLLLLAFLLLFETRSRYVYLDVPLVVIAAVGTLTAAPALVARLRTMPVLQALGVGRRPRRGAPSDAID